MPATYDPIATVNFVSELNVNFTNIPQNFTDLRVVFLSRGNSGNNNLLMRVNNNSGAVYTWRELWGNGTSVGAGQSTNTAQIYLDNIWYMNQTIASAFIIDFMSYSNNTTFKYMYSKALENYAGVISQGAVNNVVSVFRDTPPITSINFFSTSAGQMTGSATLYGILRA